MSSFNELLCPKCGEPLDKAALKTRLYCPHCKTNLKNDLYIDFLEYIIEQGIVDNIDFFDASLFGNDFLRYESNDMDSEHDIADVENDNPQNFLDDNMISIEDEFIADIEPAQGEQDDFTVFEVDESDDDNE
ncbi:MAG: hypothetical protein DRP93_00720 [Candidatus Neomarinimicrobiota bacterium]|nr:MAG: hypothetical protein DRP93_00720 [Candidatus Neomarinimicrobiota bacterium]